MTQAEKVTELVWIHERRRLVSLDVVDVHRTESESREMLVVLPRQSGDGVVVMVDEEHHCVRLILGLLRM